MGAYIVRVGLLIGVVALGIGVAYYHADDSGDKTWQTMIFTTLAFLQIGQALASRSTDESLFTLGLRTNPLLLFMAIFVLSCSLWRSICLSSTTFSRSNHYRRRNWRCVSGWAAWRCGD